MNSREKEMLNVAHRVMALGSILTSSDLPALNKIGNELGEQGAKLVMEVRQGPLGEEDIDCVKAIVALKMVELNDFVTVIPESRILTPE